MSNAAGYVCPQCGSTEGTPNQDGTTDWFWRKLPHGRVGPFCSTDCLRLTIADEGRFTMTEFRKLEFYRHRAQREDCTPTATMHWRKVQDGNKPIWYEALTLVPVEAS